jgi:hypothetical protein
MKSMVSGTILAVVLFVVAAACWTEAQVTRRVADAHRRLATLHYDAEDDIDGAVTVFNRLPWPGGEGPGDVKRHRATVSYWMVRYDSLAEIPLATGQQAVNDPSMLLVAANAAFRNAHPQEGDRKAGVERLDSVVQQYADVLRKDPDNADASYNYEFVSKMRDTLAKGPAKAAPKDNKKAEKAELVSVDLPSGPTVHGRPGAPPEGTAMSDFKTVTPMRYDEREEQMDPGRGKEIKRKG